MKKLSNIFFSVLIFFASTISGFATTQNLSSPTGAVRFSYDEYTNNLSQVYQINTNTFQTINFEFAYYLEYDTDYFQIFSIDNNGVENLIFDSRSEPNENWGSITSNVPSGRAKIVVNTNSSICYNDGYTDYWGLEISYTALNYTFTSNAFTNSNATIAGNLSVGGNNPVTKLQLFGTTDLSPTTHGLMVLGATNSTNIGIDQNEIMARNDGAVSTLYFNHEGGNIILNGTNGIGNVGIGTISPTSSLAFGGTLARTIQMERNTISSSAGKGLTISSGGATVGSTNLAGGDVTLKSGVSTGTGTSSIHFLTATAGTSGSVDRTPSEKMTILGNGNVGIGTTAPDKLLTVKGIIHAQEVQIDVTGFADYVFEKEYNLKPLNEVHSFITENGHLPEIPSENEVKKSGMNVADMQVLLLKKIEELTLYAIEQQKRIEALENEARGVKEKQ